MGEILGLEMEVGLVVRTSLLVWTWLDLDHAAISMMCHNVVTLSLNVGPLSAYECHLVVEKIVFRNVIPQVETQCVSRSTKGAIKCDLEGPELHTVKLDSITMLIAPLLEQSFSSFLIITSDVHRMLSPKLRLSSDHVTNGACDCWPFELKWFGLVVGLGAILGLVHIKMDWR